MNNNQRLQQFDYLQEMVKEGLYNDLCWSQAYIIEPEDLKNIKSIGPEPHIIFSQENVITSIKN